MLSHDALAEVLEAPANLIGSSEKAKLHPAVPHHFEVWDVASSAARKLEIDDEIIFKTDRNSHFIKSFYHTKMGSFEGLEGGQVG